MEPEFVVAPAPTPASVAGVEKSGRGSKPRSKEASKDASGGSKRGKHGVAASSRQLLRGEKYHNLTSLRLYPLTTLPNLI